MSRFVGLLMLMHLWIPSVAADPAGVTNSVRTQGCAGGAGVIAPLRAQAQLDEAARRLSRGDTLETSTSAAGYRASRSVAIHIRRAKDDEAVAAILRGKRYCELVTDPGFEELGVFQRGDETWLLLAAPFTPPAAEDAAAIAKAVLKLVNEARSRARRCGFKKFAAATPLEPDSVLDQAALLHARDMAQRGHMSHEGHDGSTVADRVTRAGYPWASVAENVAAGQTSADDVVEIWLDSPGHCANLMDPEYTEMGVAYAVNPATESGIYWAQVFAAPRATAPQ